VNKRAYKYRFFPTEEQRIALARTFGCCRMVFNWGLSERSTAYRERGEKLYYNDLSARLPALKQGRPWLDEVSSVLVQQALRNLDKAFTNFFKGRAKYPKCHQKHHAQAETYTKAAFKLEGTTLRLAKMEAPLAIV
jgi:putative transposase